MEETKRLIGIEIGKMFAQPQYRISYMLDLDSNEESVKQKSILLPPGIPTRDIVINAVIVEEYPNDKMQAVQNNYLLDPTDENIKKQMERMQTCRKQAKEVANEVIKIIELNNTQDEGQNNEDIEETDSVS